MDELISPVAVAQDSLIRLENDLTMAKMVSREFEGKFGVKNEKIGYTFNARLPVRFRGRRGDGIKPEGIQAGMEHAAAQTEAILGQAQQAQQPAAPGAAPPPQLPQPPQAPSQPPPPAAPAGPLPS